MPAMTVRFATGLLTASGLIDNMIPPSIAMILYAVVAEQSLVRIFTAGFVPGFLFALAFVAYMLVKSWRSAIDPPEPFSWRRLGRETLNAAWALGMPLIILGGIYSGLFSATEAGGVACVYAILVAMSGLSRGRRDPTSPARAPRRLRHLADRW